MKKTCTFILSCCLIFFFSGVIQAQTKHIVLLKVNTAEINKPNLEPFCSFEGQEPEVSDVDFTILVSNGDTIIWRGISTSSDEDAVNIKSINYRGGQNVLGQNVINGNGSEVVAIVQNAEVGQEEKYAISFEVLNGGTQRNGTFVIDPKLKVH